MSNRPRKIEYVPLSEVQRADENVKAHDDEGIAEAIDQLGYIDAGVLDGRTGKLLGGHGRLDALLERRAAGGGPPDGIVLRRDGEWLVPVQTGWSSADDDEADAAALALNQLTISGGFLDDPLAAMLQRLDAGRGLTGTGFDRSDLSRLLDRTRPPTPPDADDVPEAVPPVSRLGDVWTLGPHALVVGKAEDPAAWDALPFPRAHLVWTDPPYGVSYVGKTADALTIDNDDLTGPRLTALLRSSFDLALARCEPGAGWFVCAPSGPEFYSFATVCTDLGLWRQIITWAKDTMVLGHSDYHYQHEAIIYGWAPTGPHQAPPDRKQTTLWTYARPKKSTTHPTMKPVEMVARAIANHTKRGQVVFDFFGGSGSALMAAERTGRVAGLIELSPGYADVICARYQAATGVRPVRDGVAHDFA